MRLLRRRTVAVLALAVGLACAAQRSMAQALKALPANPLVVVKFNNPEAVSKKVADFAKRLGVDKFNPGFADPLGMMKQEMNLKEGFDATGEFALGVYEPKKVEGAAGANAEDQNDEPRLVALVPVTSYEAFLKNFKNVKSEGNLSTFSLPDQEDTMYAANWGKYAAFTDKRGMDLIKEKGTGIEVAGLSAKQLASQDAILFANAKLLGTKLLPEFKKNRGMAITQMEEQVGNQPNFNKKYLPVLKAAVNQALNTVEQTLTDAQSATIGLTLNEKGINTTVVAEFEPTSYIGTQMKSARNTDASLTAGLPNRKYFAFGGMAINSQSAVKLFDDVTGPIVKELQALGNDGQLILGFVDAVKTSLAATQTAAMGYAAPTAPPGQQSLMQQVFVYTGDAKKIQESSAKSFDGVKALMKMMPQAPGITSTFDYRKGVKAVEGVQLDQMVIDMKADANAGPEAAQAQQMMTMIYGPNGMGGYLGAINEKTYIGVTGGNDELLAATVKAAKANEAGLGQLAQVKAVSDALPQSRAMVYYIDLGNILSTGLQFAQQFGMQMPLKLPADMPPVGISAGTEGGALRIDTHLSIELIETLVSTGLQAAMMMQGQKQPGQL